jgi:hypothetical protein
MNKQQLVAALLLVVSALDLVAFSVYAYRWEIQFPRAPAAYWVATLMVTATREPWTEEVATGSDPVLAFMGATIAMDGVLDPYSTCWMWVTVVGHAVWWGWVRRRSAAAIAPSDVFVEGSPTSTLVEFTEFDDADDEL